MFSEVFSITRIVDTIGIRYNMSILVKNTAAIESLFVLIVVYILFIRIRALIL